MRRHCALQRVNGAQQHAEYTCTQRTRLLYTVRLAYSQYNAEAHKSCSYAHVLATLTVDYRII